MHNSFSTCWIQRGASLKTPSGRERLERSILRVPFMEIVLMRARYGGVLLTVPAPANAGT